jgi:hypothetical protein
MRENDWRARPLLDVIDKLVIFKHRRLVCDAFMVDRVHKLLQAQKNSTPYTGHSPIIRRFCQIGEFHFRKEVTNFVGLPKDLTTERTENTEKTSKKSQWASCSLWWVTC